MPGVGRLKRTCKDAFRLAGAVSTKDISIRYVRRSGRGFPETGCILEHQILRFAKMISPDKCSNSYDLASLLFRGRCSPLDTWKAKTQNALAPARQLCTQLFIFEGSIADLFVFDVLKFRKNEEVLQNCFVLDMTTANFIQLLKEVAHI